MAASTYGRVAQTVAVRLHLLKISGPYLDGLENCHTTGDGGGLLANGIPQGPGFLGIIMNPQQIELIRESLGRFGECTIRLEGSSMWPCIKQGTEVVVKTGPKVPKIGSVGVFLAGSQLIAHRIIFRKKRKAGDGWAVWARGDAYWGSTHCFYNDQLLGVVAGRKPDARKGKHKESPIPISKVLPVIGIILSPFLLLYWRRKLL